MSLQLQLFGRLRITHAGTELAHLLRPRSQRLLGYLLLDRRSPVSREKIAFILWSDSLETAALANLRRALHGLHAVLPRDHEWIIASRGELRWNPDTPYWLDVEEYERLIRQGIPATLHDAAALYTGDLLPELGDEWVVIERERLHQAQHDLLGQLVAHHRALGEYEIALELARQRLALEPLAESAHRDLMALHYLAGDRAAAIAAYDRLRITLRDELNVEPMTETRSLLEAIVQSAPLPVPQALPFSPQVISPPTQAVPRLIGREAEMAELGALWERAATGRGRLAMVSGRAGVGKTHLALKLAEYVAKRGGLALVGHCYEFERALPYQAIVEMLRAATNLLRHTALPPAHRAALARVAPDVLGAAGSPGADKVVKDASQAQLFEALLQAFLALARSQPVLLLIEDMHWASESTLDWLTYIVPRLAASRILVAVTYRTEEVGSSHPLARLGRRFACEDVASSLPLGPLSREENRELVAQMSGLADDMAVPIADRLFVETAGNPFFLREMVRGLIEAGQIAVAGGQWTGPFLEAVPDARVPLPDSVCETINARVERLTNSSRELIRGAAAVGRVFEYRIVQQARAWEDETALGALEDLLARDFIRQEETEGEFAFAHHLVREAIYAEMAAPRRTYWHQRIGRAIEQLHPGDESRLGDLAYHHFHGRAWEKAAEYSERAARQAETHYADDEALGYHRQALDALTRLPDSTEMRERRFDILALMERAADRRGKRALEGELLDETMVLARELADDARIAHVQCYRGHYLRLIGRSREALEVLKEARENAAAAVKAGQEVAAPTLVFSLGTSAMTSAVMGKHAAARAWYEQALECCAEASFPLDFPLARWRCVHVRNLGHVLCWEGRFQTALDRSQDALAGFQDMPGVPRYEIGFSMSTLGWIYTKLGAVELARTMLSQARDIVETAGIRYHIAVADLFLAEIRQLEGWMNGAPIIQAEAKTMFERAISFFREEGASHMLTLALPALAQAELEAGNLAAARNLLLEAAEISQGMDAAMREIVALSGLVRYHLAACDVEAALATSVKAIERFELLGEDSKDEPAIRFIHYQALLAREQEAEAQRQLERAYQVLQRQADELRAPALRASLLNNVPPHPEILAAWEREHAKRKNVKEVAP